jgi:hypothetical protein
MQEGKVVAYSYQ